MTTPKIWKPRKTETIKRLLRCVNEVHCMFCRYETPGNPLELPTDWLLFDDGALMCDECQKRMMSEKIEPTKTL